MDLPTLVENGVTTSGSLSGITQKLPEGVQFEFAHTQFFVPAPEGQNTHLALRYINPTHLGFWGIDPEDFGFLSLSEATFILKDRTKAMEEIKAKSEIQWVLGKASSIDMESSPMILFLKTQEGGAFVASPDLYILGPDGALDPSEMPNYFAKWQEYHKEYFEKKETEDALPVDFGLEKMGPPTQA